MKEAELNQSSPAARTEGSLQQPGSVDTWRLHILGPDDLIPMESELHALREANMLNIAMARVRAKRPNNPNEPWCMAVVERNGIPYTNDQAQRPGTLSHTNATAAPMPGSLQRRG